MGFYINPQNRTKETWLEMFGQKVDSPKWPPPNGTIPVCLIDNGPFTAAGIAYNEKEFDVFLEPDSTSEQIEADRQRVEADGIAFVSFDSGHQRPRIWYYVPVKLVVEITPDVEEFLWRPLNDSTMHLR